MTFVGSFSCDFVAWVSFQVLLGVVCVYFWIVLLSVLVNLLFC